MSNCGFLTLLSAGEREEWALGRCVDAEDVHPPKTLGLLGLAGSGVEAHRVFQSAGDYLDGWDVVLIGAVHFGGYIADVALDLPDTLARASLASEQAYVAGVGLGIVGTDEREQRGLATAVLSGESPAFSL